MLTILLESPSGLHGYDITRATGVGPGTLYPMLARFEDRDLLSSEWEVAKQPGRPARRIYRLTKEGETFARDLFDEAMVEQCRDTEDPKLA